MAQIVKLRRSSVSGQKPTNSNLQLGELALNTSDGKIFMAVSGALSPTVEEAIVTNASNTGSINLSGSIRLNGTETVTGSVLVNGLLQVTGNTSLTSLVISGSDSVANVQAFVPSSSVYNEAGFNTPDRVASGIRFNWSNENWTIGAARGLTTDVDGLVFSRNGDRNLLLHESGDMYLTGALRVTGSLYLNGEVVGTGKLNETDFNNYTSSVSSQFAGSSSYALTASHALNAVILDGQTKTQNFSTPSTTWSFNHQMGERYPSITVFDDNGYVVIPSEIRAIDDNNLNVYFPSNQTGLVSVTVGGAGTAGTSGTSGISGTSGTSGVNGTSGTSGTSGATGTSGTSGTSGRDGIGGKSETFASATTWSVFHNLDERYPVVNVWDDNGRIIIPSEIQSVDNNNLNVYFSSPVSGSVNIVKGGHLVSGAVDLSTALFSSNIVSSSVQITNLGFATTSSVLNIDTSSLATTGSNTFKGDQTFSGSLIPVGSGSYDLGSETNPFRHLYLSSASLYIDGQKVLGSTNQELQITTDNGQSIKILEQGSDTITFQTADGDIQLKSSGGGNILIDPTTGSVDVRGNVVLQDGFKILSSGDNSVVFGDDIIVSGSLQTTGNINGVNIINLSSSVVNNGTVVNGLNEYTSSLKTAINVSGSNVEVLGNLTVQGTTTTVNSTTVSIGDNIIELNGTGVANGGLLVKDPTAPNTVSGSLLWDSTNDYWKAGQLGSESKLLRATGDNVVSGSSQIVYSGLTGIPSGIVSGSSQIVLSGTTGYGTVLNQSVLTSSSPTFAGLTVNGTTKTTSTGVDGTFADAFIAQYSSNNNETNAIQTSVSSVAQSSGFRFQVSNGGGSTGRTTVADFTRSNQTFYGNVLPSSNGTQDLGSSSNRWGTIYTSDLSLNNGIGNWTIVEGEDDLFLYNNKKGKVYKFALIEVDPSEATPKMSE